METIKVKKVSFGKYQIADDGNIECVRKGKSNILHQTGTNIYFMNIIGHITAISMSDDKGGAIEYDNNYWDNFDEIREIEKEIREKRKMLDRDLSYIKLFSVKIVLSRLP